MHLLDVNYDVLDLILALLPAPAALALALTNHAFYALALPHVLAHPVLTPVFYKSCTGPTLLTRFCASLLSDPHCARHLRSLSLSRDVFRTRARTDYSAAPALAELLRHATGLHTLTLWDADSLLAAPSAAVLYDVLPLLGNLHTLVLAGAVPPIPILTRAFPHLRSLRILDAGAACGPDWDDDSLSPSALPDGTKCPPVCWPRGLDHLRCGQPIRPLTCSVRRIDLRDPIQPSTLTSTLAFLRNTAPAVFSCTVSTDHIAEIAAAIPGLLFLELGIAGVRGFACWADLAAWLTVAAHALRVVPLTALSFVRASTPLPFTPTAAEVSKLGVALVQLVPSLAYLCLPFPASNIAPAVTSSTDSDSAAAIWHSIVRTSQPASTSIISSPTLVSLNLHEGAAVHRRLLALDNRY